MAEDSEREELLRIMRAQAEAIQNLSELTRRALDAATGARKSLERPAAPESQQRRHHPQDPQYRDWDTFKRFMQHLEEVVREDRDLKPDDRLTRQMLADAGGFSLRSLRRYMVDTHGMVGDEWPPSTWPDEPPARQN